MDTPASIVQAFGGSISHVLSIVRFGSSIYSEHYGDLDLCVVVKQNEFYQFLSEIRKLKLPTLFDISLIREEELATTPFRFGSHGPHLLLSLKAGRACYGENLFLSLPDPDELLVRESILDRLYDYVYEVRKLEVTGQNSSLSLEKRWGKFKRLALYLLTSNYTFPEVLSLPENEVIQSMKVAGIDYEKDFSPSNFEHIWEKILKSNSQS